VTDNEVVVRRLARWIAESGDDLPVPDPTPVGVLEAAYEVPAIVWADAPPLWVIFDCLLPTEALEGRSTRYLVFGGKGLSVGVRVARAWPRAKLTGRIPNHRDGIAVCLCLGYGGECVVGNVSDHRFECDPVPPGPASLLFVGSSTGGAWKARTQWATF
jgi:hypothetical protein